MHRRITDFHQDAKGDWIAGLECGHGQHVRHEPPWMVREWVLTEATRRARIGTTLNCVVCDEAAASDLPTERAAFQEARLPGLGHAGALEVALKPKGTPAVLESGFEPHGPPPIVKAWRFFAIVLSVLAAGFGVLLLRVRWARPTDFDIIGFLWLLQNILPLGVLILFLFCATGAAYYWFKVWLAGR